MASHSKFRNHVVDNLIPTISDSDDDIPDLDAAAAQSQLQAGKKRKRASQDHDVAAIDPGFEFEVDGDGFGVVEGLDGSWNLASNNDVGNGQNLNGFSVEDIIARRRKKPEREAVGHDHAESMARYHDNIVSFKDAELSDDEMLADDVFGMGAPRDDEDEKEHRSIDEEDSEDESGKDGISGPSVSGHRSDADPESDDEGDMAAPLPHPDDELSDRENQDPEEQARRDAFFAPAEPPGKNIYAGPSSQSSFQTMNLSRPVLRGLNTLNFTAPTPIQSKTIPLALLGKDLVGGAVTGSGKTAAFVLPILERLLYRPKKLPTTRVGILMPTRELAVQCYNVAKKLASFTDITFALLVGGLSLREQEQTLKRRPDVVVATPGRFIDHMRNTASFVVENLEILVLDEADRMLEDGFADELNEVLSTIPKSRQTMLFSATMTQDVDKLIRVGLNKPVRLMVDAKEQTVSGLVQEYVKLKGGNPKKENEEEAEFRRLAYLVQLCSQVYRAKTIVFLPTKQLAHRIKVLFALHGVRAAELHGSMSQEQRLNAIASFRDGRATHLLATDLASRGLDIPRVETVLNYSVPTTSTAYLHRVGRTARAGRAGVACTLFSPQRQSSSKTKSDKGKAASERALLRPILRLAKSQAAPIRTRTLPTPAITSLIDQIRSLQPEIDAIIKEEKEERLIMQAERDATKGENMVKYEDEIKSRPRRTWFQSEKDKKAAKEVGKDTRLGVEIDEKLAAQKSKKRKLSGKERKRLVDRDERKEGGLGWKKGKGDGKRDVKKRKGKKGGK